LNIRVSSSFWLRHGQFWLFVRRFGVRKATVITNPISMFRLYGTGLLDCRIVLDSRIIRLSQPEMINDDTIIITVYLQISRYDR